MSGAVTTESSVSGGRDGEALDIERVNAWLRGQIEGLEGLPEVHQYTHGASNWTYRLQYPDRALVLRRPPVGTKAKSAHNMVREFQLQAALKPLFPLIPQMLALCQDQDVLGCDFYVMEHLDGAVPGRRMPRDIELDAASATQLCENMIDTLVQLHQVDHTHPDIAALAPGTGYARRQIDGWSERYRRARTWNVPKAEGVMRWLDQNVPNDERLCVVHNDFRLDNLVLDRSEPTQIRGVLDWELATVGDPLMDVGNSMAYWIEAGDDFLARSTRRQPSHLPGMLSRQAFVERYCERMGFDPADWAFYEVYGLFRLAGIVQQIYYRYHHKQTRNPAFKRFWLFCNYLIYRANRARK